MDFASENLDQVAVAERHVKSRIVFYKKLLADRKGNEKYFEENTTLLDGALLQHIETPEECVYYLVNGERWMFLEKSPRTKILYVCEVDEEGKKSLSTNTTIQKKADDSANKV